MKRKANYSFIFVSILIAVLFLVGCTSQGSYPSGTPVTSTPQDTSNPVTSGTDSGATPADTQTPTTTNTTPSTTTPVTTTPDVPVETGPTKITLAELATHDNKKDCWVAYKGEVYDITAFLPKHPGSSFVIEPYCGTSDKFEKAFFMQHGNSQVAKLKKVGITKGVLA